MGKYYICNVLSSERQAIVNVVVKGNELHILDTGLGTTLTQSIDIIQRDLLIQLGLGDDKSINDYQWIIYHTDGVVSNYHRESDGFDFLDLNNSSLIPDCATYDRSESWV